MEYLMPKGVSGYFSRNNFMLFKELVAPALTSTGKTFP